VHLLLEGMTSNVGALHRPARQADPIKVDSADPADAMGQLAVLLLALFAQMDRT